jgi:hypothetical protein
MLCCWFSGAYETMGQVPQCTGRLCWEIKVFFKSVLLFVTYLLTYPRINEFEISAPDFPTHYSPAGNGDVLDIHVHKNIRMSEFTVSDILDSENLPIVSHTLDRVRTRNLTNPMDKLTDWEWFQRLASEWISLRISWTVWWRPWVTGED